MSKCRPGSENQNRPLTAAALVLDAGDGAALPPVQRVRHGADCALERPTRRPDEGRADGEPPEARGPELGVREIGERVERERVRPSSVPGAGVGVVRVHEGGESREPRREAFPCSAHQASPAQGSQRLRAAVPPGPWREEDSGALLL